MKFFIYFKCSGINGLHFTENEVIKPKVVKEVRDIDTKKIADCLPGYRKMARLPEGLTTKTMSGSTRVPITK